MQGLYPTLWALFIKHPRLIRLIRQISVSLGQKFTLHLVSHSAKVMLMVSCPFFNANQIDWGWVELQYYTLKWWFLHNSIMLCSIYLNIKLELTESSWDIKVNFSYLLSLVCFLTFSLKFPDNQCWEFTALSVLNWLTWNIYFRPNTRASFYMMSFQLDTSSITFCYQNNIQQAETVDIGTVGYINTCYVFFILHFSYVPSLFKISFWSLFLSKTDTQSESVRSFSTHIGFEVTYIDLPIQL